MLNLEQQLRSFETQRFPTDAQTVTNNAQILYKRKKYFLEQLRSSLSFVGYLLSVIIYIKDASLLVLVAHAGMQCSINIHRKVLAQANLLGDATHTSSHLFAYVCMLNGLCLILHVWQPLTDGDIQDRWIISFIGEAAPHRAVLIAYDLILLASSLVHLCMEVTRDGDLMAITPREESGDFGARADVCGDGYNGDVYLAKVDIVKTCLKLVETEESPNDVV